MPGHHTNRRWIIIADGGRARVLGLAANGESLDTLHEITSPDIHRQTHDLVTDGPGRSFESASMARHAIAAKTDPHAQAKEDFITDLATMLVGENQAHAFDDLVLVVTKAQAHHLQTALDDATRAKVREVITKDLVKTPNPKIWDRMIEARLLPSRPTMPGTR